MAAHRGVLPCVMIGVGAAFDFFSGRKTYAALDAAGGAGMAVSPRAIYPWRM